MLASYGPDLRETPRKLATYRPDPQRRPARRLANLSRSSNKYVIVINLKTAKALKLTIPKSLLLRADKGDTVKWGMALCCLAPLT